MRNQQELGKRKVRRVDCQRPAFIIVSPNGCLMECHLKDISETGACVDVGNLSVPDLFAIALTSNGEVVRLCRKVWRRGRFVGARFVNVKQLRNSVEKPD